jgi:hypothetical protein
VSWSTTSFSAPLGSPRIARPRAQRKIGRGGRHAPAGGRGLLGGQAHGGKRRPGVYRPRQALAADLSGFPERVAAGHGLRRHRLVGQPGWAGHVAGGVDAGRGGALLVDGDAAVVPKPHAGVVRPSSSTLGRRASAQITASASTGRTEHYANRDESRAVEAPPLAI